MGIAAGTPLAFDHAAALVHGGPTYGMGLVMLYGGIGVWVCAALSFLIVDARDHRNA